MHVHLYTQTATGGGGRGAEVDGDREGKREGGKGNNNKKKMKSASHHIYRCPLLSGWGVLALAFSDTTSKRGRSAEAGGRKENTHTLRADRYDQHPALVKAQKSLVDNKSPVKL